MCGYAPCRRVRQRRLEESRSRKACDDLSWNSLSSDKIRLTAKYAKSTKINFPNVKNLFSMRTLRSLLSMSSDLRVPRAFVVRLLIHAVQPRAVVPENLLSGAARDVHPHEMIDGIGPMGIRVGIVCRNHDIVIADSIDDIRNQLLL